MGLFDFASIRRSVAGLEQQIQKMKEELEALRRKRDAVLYAPASKEDLKSMLSEWVKNSGYKYRASLTAALAKFARSPRNMTPIGLAQILSISGIEQPLGDAVRPHDVDQALCALFGPLLNEALMAHVDSMDWPEGSVSSDARARDVAALDGRIDKLQQELNELINSAEEAGITWNRS